MKNLKLYSDENLIPEIKADNLFAFDILFKRNSKKHNNFSNSFYASDRVSEDIFPEVHFIEPG